MKATTKTITTIDVTEKEYSSLNATTWIFTQIYHDKDTTTKNAIETEWKNQGLNVNIEEMLSALNVICNLAEIVYGEE